jgi:hypothetical protein
MLTNISIISQKRLLELSPSHKFTWTEAFPLEASLRTLYIKNKFLQIPEKKKKRNKNKQKKNKHPSTVADFSVVLYNIFPSIGSTRILLDFFYDHQFLNLIDS